MIAVKMNDEPLPGAHGFPARLIVPGLYGYVSATKWLRELELTTLEAFDAYWVPLGWAKEAPILTQSRIDIAEDGTSRAGAGAVAVAGVAWAPDRGDRAGRGRGRRRRVAGRRRSPPLSGPRPGSSGSWAWQATPGRPHHRRPRDRRHRRGPDGPCHAGPTPTAPAATTGSRVRVG